MDKYNQKPIKPMPEQAESQNAMLKQEIDRRHQAEKRLAVLSEELEAFKSEMASYKQNMEERIRFDMLLSDISAHFINLPSEQVDNEIMDVQRQVCKLLGLDLCTLWQWSDDDLETYILTHYYRPLGGPPVPEKMRAIDFFPWSQQRIREGRRATVSSMDNLPPEAARDKESWRHYGIKATVTIPLQLSGEQVVGAISFNDMQSERTWSETILQRLHLVATIFANAIARKFKDQDLREAERRLRMATDAARAGLWGMDMDTEKVWVSSSLRDLFYFSPEEEVTYQSFLGKIHPDDHDRVRQSVEQAIHSKKNLYIDYRIVLPDGQIRWICARGKLHLKPDGKSSRLMGISVDITDRVKIENQLKDRIQEIAKLKQQVENENLVLKQEVKFFGEHSKIVGQSLAMKRILAEAEQVAFTDSTILVLGETGTGKEMLARFIHQVSKRKNRPMVTINCASLPATLIESELFGREKGAYTGALTQMIGRFEIADGSTLFLDEIGEIPLELQSKLLRVLEEGVFERLGSTKPIHTNVRIIAATNRDLENEVSKGRFRKDLFYRLSVFPILMPPLRDRPEDIPLLVWSFVEEFKMRMGKEVNAIPSKSMESLRSYSWPGNVRELRNVVEHAMILCTNANLSIRPPQSGLEQQNSMDKLVDIERQHILSVLERSNWRVSAAAGILGLKRSTLNSKMKKLSISRPNP
ncbi:MAG: sigma 54-interacting transcriptional regulator [Desulfobacteraceae bacterium]|nr:sigma 54-interacting transcriptional regulator [Desulfobacteraceae bacterium]